MAIGHVQTVGAAAENVASATTAPITTTPGNLLHVDMTWYDDSPASGVFSSLTDNKGNTWTLVQELSDAVGGATGRTAIRQAYAKDCLGGASHTFTLTLDGAGYPTIAVTEISGLDAAAPKDQHSGTSNNATSVSSGNISTTAADEILCGAATADQSGSMPFIMDTDYTQRFNQPTTAQFEGLLTGTRIVSSPETNEFLGQITAVGNLASVVVSYKATAGGGAVDTPIRPPSAIKRSRHLTTWSWLAPTL